MEDYQALKGNINNTKIMIVFFFQCIRKSNNPDDYSVNI